MALVMLSSTVLPGWIYLALAAITLAALVLARREMGQQGMALLLVLLLCFGVPIALTAADDPGLVVYSDCDGLTPWDWQWYTRMCGLR